MPSSVKTRKSTKMTDESLTNRRLMVVSQLFMLTGLMEGRPMALWTVSEVHHWWGQVIGKPPGKRTIRRYMGSLVDQGILEAIMTPGSDPILYKWVGYPPPIVQ